MILYDKPSGKPIGGGGYDLSGTVYGLALFAYIGLWMFWMLIAGLVSKDPMNMKMYMRLILVGVLALLIAWVITPPIF